MARQDQLYSTSAPELHVVLDEAVLHRSFGGRHILRDQLAHLLQTTEKPFLDLRVLPFSNSEHSVLATSFTILLFERDSDIVYVETAAGGVYEHEEDVPIYHEVFTRLRDATLDAEESVAVLRQALERLT
jgi:hypothetical protein